MGVTVSFQFEPENGMFLNSTEMNQIKEWVEMCGGEDIEVDDWPLVVPSDGSW